MNPDQNQPQTPPISPDNPDPSLSPMPEPAQATSPMTPLAQGEQTASPLDATQTQPASQALPTTPEPAIPPADPSVGQSPAPIADPTPQPQPVVTPIQPQPVQPNTTGLTPQAASQSIDPTQPGYVPPISNMAPGMGAMPPTPKSGGGLKKLRVIIAIVFGLIVVSGLGIFIKDTLFSGSKITTADLIEETAGNATFKHPKQWTKVTEDGADAAYSEGGKKLDESDQGMAVVTQKFPIDYETLPQAQKDAIYTELEKEFSDKTKLQESMNSGSKNSCPEISNQRVRKMDHSNYSLAVMVEFTCDNFAKRNVKGQYKMLVAIKNDKITVLAIGAIDKTWNKSGDALNSIFESAKLAN